MAIPDYQSIMSPLLDLAGDNETHRVHDAVDLLAQKFKLTAEESREVIPSGRVSRFHNNVTWARTYLKKAGLLEDPKRGEFRITERGRQVLAGGHGRIGVRFLEQFDEFRTFKTARRAPRPDAAAKLDLPEETPEEALQAAYQTLRNSVASDLLDQVRRSSPTFFERLVVDVLVAMGYGGSRREAGEAIGHAGDEGIDGIIKEDRLGLDIIYIQAKRWENTVGRPEVQRFAGALAGEACSQGRLHHDIFVFSRSQGLRRQHRHQGNPDRRNATRGAHDRLRRWRHDRRDLRGEADRRGLLRRRMRVPQPHGRRAYRRTPDLGFARR